MVTHDIPPKLSLAVSILFICFTVLKTIRQTHVSENVEINVDVTSN